MRTVTRLRPSIAGRRGLTLIELLLVVGLLLAAGALVFPSMLDRMNERAFDSTTDVLINQLMLARAHARAAGEPVEVRYRLEPARVEAARFDPAGAGEQPGFAELAPVEAPGSLLIAEGWATRRIPDGFWIDAEPPPEALAPSAGATPVSVTAGLGGDDERGAEPLRIAVFLPDGSALLAEPLWLGDRAGRFGRLTVNAWTGLPAFERIDPGTLGEPEGREPEADEQTTEDEGRLEDEAPEPRSMLDEGGPDPAPATEPAAPDEDEDEDDEEPGP